MKFTKSKVRMMSHLGSCGAYGYAMTTLPEADARVVACTADLCFYSGLERFQRLYPESLYNVGIAEQNLVGIAAGLAHEGYRPYASTYASFACTRALDQVKVNLAYMQLPVRLIGLSAGLAAGILGPTHICTEDLAILRSLPNLVIVSSADGMEIVKALEASLTLEAPFYLRLTGGMELPPVYQEDYDFVIGKAVELRSGEDVAVIAQGSMVSSALKMADHLEQAHGIRCKVLNLHTLKPLDEEALDALRSYPLVVTIEEHSVYGGLGSAVSEFFTRRSQAPRVLRLGVSDFYPHAARYGALLEECGLTPERMEIRVLQAWQEAR